MSSPLPMRPAGMRCPCSFTCVGVSPICSSAAVAMWPGCTMFTVMPEPRQACAHAGTRTRTSICAHAHAEPDGLSHKLTLTLTLMHTRMLTHELVRHDLA
jgi:hypothetical protein